jgi:hypothetical protein
MKAVRDFTDKGGIDYNTPTLMQDVKDKVTKARASLIRS